VCRHEQLSLPARPESASAARRFVQSRAERWGLDEVAYEAGLLVTELVTNSLLHARTPAVLTLSVVHGVVEAAVVDGDVRVPVLRPARKDLLADLDAIQGVPDDSDARHHSLQVGESGAVTAGRGLAIVDALAQEWGSSHQASGKAVWFTLAAPSDWKWRSECRCTVIGSTTTASGRPVEHVSGPWDGDIP
jgi:hypothetical protein